MGIPVGIPMLFPRYQYEPMSLYSVEIDLLAGVLVGYHCGK